MFAIVVVSIASFVSACCAFNYTLSHTDIDRDVEQPSGSEQQPNASQESESGSKAGTAGSEPCCHMAALEGYKRLCTLWDCCNQKNV